MLRGLFSNQNIERILLFLFVNERCYGTELQTKLQVPLTPIQKALQRLEREGIVSSHFEGKTRIYELSSLYSLRHELEMLLKKAYTLLPTQEKKRYCFVHKPHVSLGEEHDRSRSRHKELLAFWEQLQKVETLSFSAKIRQEDTQTIKIGKAEVEVTAPTSTTIIFQERGHWMHDQEPETAFSNSFKWTLDLSSSLIALEHLRYGINRPVFLFHLTPTHSHFLESVDAHLCAEDTYLGNVTWNQKSINFHWRIIGPNKNQHLTYHYR
jgi:sugar-specific transcriptional regulator TrmB